MSEHTSVNGGQPPGKGWVRSSYSGYNGNCVDVLALRDRCMVAVRHSKRPSGPVLVYSSEEWHRFLLRVRSGELN
jgi:hypothetical protein